MTSDESAAKQAAKIPAALSADQQSNKPDSATSAEQPIATVEAKSQHKAGGEPAESGTAFVNQPEANAASSNAPTGADAANPATAPKSMAAQTQPATPVNRPASVPKPSPKPAVAPKAAGIEKPPPAPAAPFVSKPSLPVTMIMRPGASLIGEGADRVFPGEIEGDFDEALRMLVAPRRRSMFSRLTARVIHCLTSRHRRQLPEVTARTIAFDGFRTSLYEEKLERDRRYGTVYTVSEQRDGFLIRLEMPRWLPNSALKNTWNLPDEMPDYDYMLTLEDNVLSIRAGVRGEAYRRLSYVSPSFPSDFLTRIEFPTAVAGFKHRLSNKLLEIIVYKRSGNDLRSAA